MKGKVIMVDLLQVGIISSTHGIKGEVKVYPTTDDMKRFSSLKEVLLDTGKEQLVLKIEGVKYFKQFVILKFKDINDINDIEKYKGKSLFVNRNNAVKLNKDEYFIADLIGMRVENDDQTFQGILTDVMETGANDVYVVETKDGQEVLLPAIKDCVIKVDIEQRLIVVHLLEGLI